MNSPYLYVTKLVIAAPILLIAFVLFGYNNDGMSGEPVSAPSDESVLASRGEADMVTQQNNDPISVTPLTDELEFTDDLDLQIRKKLDGRPREVINLRDASRMQVLDVTIQPGVRLPWHSHPGLLFVAVIEGSFDFIYGDDCVVRTYNAGESFVDPGFDNFHMGRNPSDTEELRIIATFLGAPSDDPLTLPVSDEHGEELDDKCGV